MRNNIPNVKQPMGAMGDGLVEEAEHTDIVVSRVSLEAGTKKGYLGPQ
jgi:hypothetical protein